MRSFTSAVTILLIVGAAVFLVACCGSGSDAAGCGNGYQSSSNAGMSVNRETRGDSYIYRFDDRANDNHVRVEVKPGCGSVHVAVGGPGEAGQWEGTFTGNCDPGAP